MLKKYAVATLKSAKLVSPEIALSSEASMEHFKQLRMAIKEFPKSNEFVYFVCRAIHAMEAANYDPVTKTFSGDGHIVKCNQDGKCEKCGNVVKESQNGLWHSSKGILPYINQNGDAFPETELLKEVEVIGSDGNKRRVQAYQTFIGRGLFVNHASDDVEKIRGIILDANWDPGTKGVDILVACDKVAYPELARQIEMGYSNDVSMGTQVQYSLCSECGNKAVTESDYCDHVKQNKGLARAGSTPVYEINNGLNFIEISVVSNGADPKAKIKTVLASLSKQVQEREAKLNSCINPIEAERIRDELRKIQAQIQELLISKEENTHTKETKCGCLNIKDEDIEKRREARNKIAQKFGLSLSDKSESKIALYNDNDNGTIIRGGQQMNSKKAYFQGGGGLNDPESTPYEKEDYDTVREKEDKQMVGQGMEPGNDGLHPGYKSTGPDLALKEKLLRASLEERRKIRQAILQKAYFQGGGGLNDPEALPYEKEDYESVRDNEDKQMVGQGMEPGNDGLHPGYKSTGPDLALKEKLLRAKLRARFVTAEKKEESAWTVFAGDKPMITATAKELYADDLFKAHEENPQITNWDWVASEEYGKNMIRAVKELGFDKVKAMIEEAKSLSKKAQELPPAPPAPATDALPPLPEEGPKVDDVEGPKPEGEKLSVKEQITKAIDKIEDAVHELRALSESEEEGTVEGLETALDLGEAGTELKGLGDKLEAAKADEKLFKRLSVVAKEALSDADKLLKRAGTLAVKKPSSPKIEKVAEKEKEEAHKEIDKAEKSLEKAEDKLGVQESAEHEMKEHVKEAKKEDVKEEKKEEKKEEEKKETKEASLLERKADRYALAAELSKLYNLTDSDMIGEAHPKGGTDTMAAGKKLEGDAHVETVKEQQDADIEVVEKQPRGELTAKTESPKTVKAEEKKPDFLDVDKDGNKKEPMTKALKDKEEGEKKEDKKEDKKEATLSDRRKARHEALKGLMSKAEVDSEAKSYYKELFNESSTGNASDPAAKAFGKEMTDEFVGKKSTAEAHELGTRMKRAYKVALKQQTIGQIENTPEALEGQVDRLIAMDTAGFEAFEDVIAHTNVVKDAKVDKPLKKSAGAVRVGLVDGQVNLSSDLNKINWS